MKPNRSRETGREAEAPGMVSIWTRLPIPRRRFILLAVVSGFALIGLGTVWFAIEILGGLPASDGITFLPLVLATVAYAVLIGASVLLVVGSAGTEPEGQTLARLGAFWALASVPLNFDYLVDTFPPKLVVSALFVVVALRYWMGLRNSYLSLFLGPMVLLIALGDGIGHFQGNFCSVGSSLDSCPAKAVSDFYLVMLMVGVTAVTLRARTQRPEIVKVVLYTAVIVAVVAVLVFVVP